MPAGLPVPDGCPKIRDGGPGPRVCGYVWCPLHRLKSHVGTPRAPGQPSSRRRLPVLGPDDDQCAADVADRGPQTYEAIAAFEGISPQSARITALRAWLKVLKRKLKLAGDG